MIFATGLKFDRMHLWQLFTLQTLDINTMKFQPTEPCLVTQAKLGKKNVIVKTIPLYFVCRYCDIDKWKRLIATVHKGYDSIDFLLGGVKQ